MSERAIAKRVGSSQPTVHRDIAALRGDSSVIHVVTEVESQEVSAQVSTPDEMPPPSDVPTRGEALVASLREEMAEQGLIPTSTEEAQLEIARDLADRAAQLQAIVAEDGECRRSQDGRIFAHPLLSEIRQCEATLSRIVGSISTTSEPVIDRQRQRAAQSRWRIRNRQTGLTAAETPVAHA